jgi:hypothetical protein
MFGWPIDIAILYKKDLVILIDEKEFLNLRNKVFIWTDLDYNDELYEMSSGRIVHISIMSKIAWKHIIVFLINICRKYT